MSAVSGARDKESGDVLRLTQISICELVNRLPDPHIQSTASIGFT